MTSALRGDLVELNGVLCVVIAVAGEQVGVEEVPKDHVAVWYGHTGGPPTGEGVARMKPEVWTVPYEYLKPSQVPNMRH